MRILLVVPCYNEASRFPRDGYEAALTHHEHLSLLFVDDGSRDGTAGVIEPLCQRHPDRCEMLVLPRNAGKGEAVRLGILHAAGRAKGVDYFGYFDADLAIPLRQAFLFFDVLGQRRPALILGARVRLLGTTRIQRSLLRHLIGRTFATVVSVVAGVAVYDTQAGAKLVRADVVKMLFERPFLDRWIFDVELLLRCVQGVGRAHIEEHVAEIPVSEMCDPGGSKITVMRSLRIPIALVRMWWMYRAA